MNYLIGIMGTASLVFGVLLIIVGVGFGVSGLIWLPSGITTTGDTLIPIGVVLLVTVPMFVIGGLLLRNYDKNKKKEKNHTD